MRAGLPVAEHHHDAPAADPATPGDGPPGRRVAGARGCSPSTSTTRSRRAPRTAAAGPHARSRSTPEAHRRFRRASAPRDPSVSPSGPRTSGLASRRRPAAGWGRARPSAIRPWTGRRRQPAGSPAPSWCPGGPRACRRRRCRPRKGAPPRCTCPPASTGSTATPSAPTRTRRCRRPRRRLPPRRRATVDPLRRRGQLPPRPGARRIPTGAPGDGAAGGRLAAALDGRRDPPGRRGRQLVHRGTGEARPGAR